VLGAVFLAVTGAEALYADLGHFGYRPIRAAWIWVAFPALSLNYLGQGALVLNRPETLENMFYLMAPEWALVPLVILATMATVIASQAVITGAYSMMRQAIQLGMMPRFVIRHTSEHQSGQIYLPALNWLLLILVVGLTFSFATSSALGAAYGIAVTFTMIITTMLAVITIRARSHRPLWQILIIAAPIFLLELTFLASNLLKLGQGGMAPVIIALLLMLLMYSWSRGASLVSERSHATSIDLNGFAKSMQDSSATTVAGVAIFLTTDTDAVPHALLHNLKHNHVIHDMNIILKVEVAEVPRVAEADRLVLEKINDRFQRLHIRFGFMETPNVSQALVSARKIGLKFDAMTTTFFLGRRRVIAGAHTGLALFMDHLYLRLTRYAADPIDYFHLPRDRVVEIGARMSM
jgi:KUP system potassium uptake protein